MFLCQSIVAIETLVQGGCFVCRITDMLGRCTVGAVLILATLFDRITCVKPEMSCPAKNERFLICVGFLGKEKAACSALLLRSVIQQIGLMGDDNSNDVVAFVPQQFLMEKGFASAVIKMNERGCKQEIVYSKYMISELKLQNNVPVDSVDLYLKNHKILERLGILDF